MRISQGQVAQSPIPKGSNANQKESPRTAFRVSDHEQSQRGRRDKRVCLTMNMNVTQDVVAIVGLVICFASVIFLSAAEAALLRISPIRAMSQEDTTRAWKTLASLIDDLPNVLNAVLFSALLAQIGAATFAG